MAGSPWGLVLTFKSLSRSEEKHGEEEGALSQGKPRAGQTPAASLTAEWVWARRAVPISQGCGEDRGSWQSTPPPPGRTDPGGGGGIHYGHSGRAGRLRAVTGVPLPRWPAPPARSPHPALRPGTPRSPFPGDQRCLPIVRSPEPGLLGAPSRWPGPGRGRGSRSPPPPSAAARAAAAASLHGCGAAT